MHFCPCGSKKAYELCCGLYLEKKQSPETPEQLMRSRYTAYSLAKIDYIKQSMKGKAAVGFNALEAKQWAEKVTWVGLAVIQSYLETNEKGFVEFKAYFMEGTSLKTIHELSEFHKEEKHWFYVDGIQKNNKNQHKVGRNSPCPCGSGKKFKNCHEK